MTIPSSCAIVPVILAGGQGSRLWPLSRGEQPKQFLPLAKAQTLLQTTLERLTSRTLGLELQPPLLLCPHQLRFQVADTLERSAQTGKLLLEPEARGTAAGIALAAFYLHNRAQDPLLLVMPSDHQIEPVISLSQAIEQATPAATNGALVLLGVPPTYPATGYGYIHAEHSEGPTFPVTCFEEKPPLKRAKALLERNTCYWNAGIFFARASTLVREFKRYAPTISVAIEQALSQSSEDEDFIRPDACAFTKAPIDSIDYAVMEKTQCAHVVPLNGCHWSDLGSFYSLWQNASKDAHGNVCRGAVEKIGGGNNLFLSEGPLIAAQDLQNMAVVATRDAVLVAPLSAQLHAGKSEETEPRFKTLVGQIKKKHPQRFEHAVQQRRPWGQFDVLERGANFLVKRLTLLPGASISRQFHRHRAEHWVIVQGHAKILKGNDSFELFANQSTYIPPLMVHQLSNPGSEPLELIEVQTGSELSEADIVRLS